MRKITSKVSILAVIVLTFQVALPSAFAGKNWPSFQNGGNTSIDAKNLPTKWSPETGIAWNIDLIGYGQSAPVIWKDRIFVSSIEGVEKETCIAAAYQLSDGKLVWEKKFPASVTKKNSQMVSRAAPTPIVDANGVYLFYESGDLIALSHSGDLKWEKAIFDNGDNAFQNGHGFGSSPTQTDDHVILLVDHKGPSYLAAFNKSDGKIAWKTKRESRTSWTSPQVAKVGESSQIVVSSNGTVDGYDSKTGELLWTHKDLTGNTIPSVTIQGDHVFVGAAEPRGGKGADKAVVSNCCLKITPNSDSNYELKWSAKKAVCSMASPMFHKNHVYYINRLGVLRCVDATTGEQKYEVRMGESCWAQPIGVEDRLYFFGKNGMTKVVKAGPEFEVIAENRLWKKKSDSSEKPDYSKSMDPIVYSAIAVDGAFVVRLGTKMLRISN